MILDPILPPSRIAASPDWQNQLLTDALDADVASRPDQAAIVDLNSMTGRSTTLSYRQYAGHTLSFLEMIRFLREQRLARNYFPERLEVLDELPRTTTGKIQKYRLREFARELVPAQPD